MKTSDSIAKIAPDLVNALAVIKGAPKDSRNPHFKNQYASLESVIEASQGTLAAWRIAAMQTVGRVIEGSVEITTRLLHISGEWIEDTAHIPLTKVDAQGLGSAVTYGRRYSLMAILNMPAVDDDGNDAVRPQERATGPISSQADPRGIKRLSSARAKEIGLDKRIMEMIDACNSDAMLDAFDANFDNLTAEAPLSWLDSIHNRSALRREEIRSEANHQELDEAYAETMR